MWKPENITKNLRDICPLPDISWHFTQDFIRELLLWDGEVKRSLCWSGTNGADADYIQCLCALGGIKASHAIQRNKHKSLRKPLHRMTFVFKETMGLRNVKKTTVNHKGMVYCVTVPYGNIIIRQNNRVAVTGNCHNSISKTRKHILDAYKDKALILGLTATPCRSDGKGLDAVYDSIIPCSSISELTKMGHLVPIQYFGSNSLPDLQDIPMVAGDYNQKILGKRVDKQKLVGDILENWLRIAPDRPTIVFATNVKHSRNIQETFSRNGISCEHIDAHTPAEERAAIIKRSESGETQILTNVAVFDQGFDAPWISCVILAKPTKSLARYIQTAGRGSRPHPGKKDCIIIDHAGTVNRHGFLDQHIEWTLSGKEIAWKTKDIAKQEKPPLTCSECQAQFRGATCPKCGFKVKSYGKKIEAMEAELHRFKKGKSTKKATKVYSIDDKQKFFGQLVLERYVKDYKPNWVLINYKKKFNQWPKNMDNIGPVEPDKEFKNWLTYQRIKFAKSHGKKK